MFVYLPPKKITGSGGLNASVTHRLGSAAKITRETPHVLEIEDAGGATFQIRVPHYQYTRIFVDKLILAFRFHPEWRENYRDFRNELPAVELANPDGTVCCADPKLANYAKALINAGHYPVELFLGDDHPTGRPPRLRFKGEAPAEFMAAGLGADWITIEGELAPAPLNGWNRLLRQNFLLLLDDWSVGELDTTGARYAVRREPLPHLAPLPALSSQAKREHQRQVAQRTSKANKKGMTASFDDMVKLRSGRDKYTNMRLPALRTALEGDSALRELESMYLDPAELQRALRWRLRGLDIPVIARKLEVDQVLESRFNRPPSEESAA